MDFSINDQPPLTKPPQLANASSMSALPSRIGHVPGIKKMLLLNDQSARSHLVPVDRAQRTSGFANMAEELNGDSRQVAIHKGIQHLHTGDQLGKRRPPLVFEVG